MKRLLNRKEKAMNIIEMNPLVTIVVPVYNSSEWLAKCLDGILHQTYKNIECIIVDDGSTDDSARIIDAYAIANNRFIIIHKKNEGVCKARNCGIEKAHGDWIVFIDSDDWIESDYIEGFLSADSRSQMVVQSIEDYLTDEPNCNIQYHFPDKLWRNKEIALLFSDEKMMKYGTPWSRIYRRDIIQKHGLKFNPLYSTKEDVLFAHQYLSKCDTISTVSYFGYHYIYHPSSLVHTMSGHVSCKAMRDVSIDIYEACMDNKNFGIHDKARILAKELCAFSLPASIRFLYGNKNVSFNEKIKFIKETKALMKKYRLQKYLLKNIKMSVYLLPAILIHIINCLKK